MKRKFLAFLLASCLIISIIPITSIYADNQTPFTDVSESYWYYNAVGFCYENNLIKGMNETIFGGELKMTRAMLVTILARMSGDDLSVYTTSSFDDVKVGDWFLPFVEWAYDQSVTNGTSPQTFSPDSVVTRQQLAIMLYRYTEYIGKDTSAKADLRGYTDASSISGWAYDFVCWAIEEGLISGTSQTTISPNADATRAQIAQIIYKYHELILSGCEHDWKDATCIDPKICNNCGAGKGLPLGHDNSGATCTTPGVCSRCGVAGSALGHNFVGATCTANGTCTRCGATTPALGHSWVNATCTTPQTCSRCNVTSGNALGHTTYNGTCSRCYQYIKDPYNALKNYLLTYGQADSNGYKYIDYIYNYDDGSTDYYIIIYDQSESCISIGDVYYDAAGWNCSSGIDIYNVTSTYNFFSVLNDGYYTLSGSGIIYPITFSANDYLGFSSYSGDPAEQTDFAVLTRVMLVDALQFADYYLTNNVGITLGDFGFTALYN